MFDSPCEFPASTLPTTLKIGSDSLRKILRLTLPLKSDPQSCPVNMTRNCPWASTQFRINWSSIDSLQYQVNFSVTIPSSQKETNCWYTFNPLTPDLIPQSSNPRGDDLSQVPRSSYYHPLLLTPLITPFLFISQTNLLIFILISCTPADGLKNRNILSFY